MTRHKLNILLIDDDPDLRDVCAELLRQGGHRVDVGENGRAGLEIAKTTVFDVAIVDYDMPVLNGLDVLAQLRAIQPNCVRLLVSGDLDVPVAIDAVNRGEAAKILAKPFQGGSLLRTIEEAIDQRHRVGEQYLSSQRQEYYGEEAALRECFAKKMLKLALQPIVSVSGREIFAYEALLRCNHHLLPSPAAVLGASERQGGLAQLGAAVVGQAAAIIGSLPEPVRLFVNLHPAELEDPDSLMECLTPLKKFANRVVLEITERSKMVNVDNWRTSTNRMIEAGFSTAIDDLGAGYSSLTMLAELKPQFVKIDMSIIRNCDKETHKRRMVELICRFGEATSSQVLAEGVETEQEAAIVASCGAQLMQGYLFGRPQLRP